LSGIFGAPVIEPPGKIALRIFAEIHVFTEFARDGCDPREKTLGQVSIVLGWVTFFVPGTQSRARSFRSKVDNHIQLGLFLGAIE